MSSSMKPSRVVFEYEDGNRIVFNRKPGEKYFDSVFQCRGVADGEWNTIQSWPATPKNSPTAANARQYIILQLGTNR